MLDAINRARKYGVPRSGLTDHAAVLLPLAPGSAGDRARSDRKSMIVSICFQRGDKTIVSDDPTMAPKAAEGCPGGLHLSAATPELRQASKLHARGRGARAHRGTGCNWASTSFGGGGWERRRGGHPPLREVAPTLKEVWRKCNTTSTGGQSYHHDRHDILYLYGCVLSCTAGNG